jgi:hypothetical protein
VGVSDRSRRKPEIAKKGEGPPLKRIQFGCGLCAPEGWRNFDASPTLRLQRLPIIGRRFTLFPVNVEYGDIVKGLPVPPESCDIIYSSHTLEHLALADMRRALLNTHSYLKSGGIFRFVIPDLARCANEYLRSGDALGFMNDLQLGRKERARGIRFVREWLGNSHHLWMWDFRSISSELSEVGFRDIRRAEFGDNPLFHDIEDKERWLNCLGVQATKS